MKQLNGLMFLAMTILAASSCKKNDDNGSVSFQLRVQNQSAPLTGRVQSGALNWVSGAAYVEKVELEAEKDDTETEMETRVRRRIDLFGSVAQLGSVQLSPGRYDEVEVELYLGNTASDTALVLRGTYVNNAGTSIPVLFFINDALEVKAEAENVVLTGTDDYRFLSTFDLSRLVTGITQSQLNNAALTNGTLVISKNNNSSLFSTILSNINEMDDVEIDD